ncbi:DUF952 domain-containing protein [Palleronia aestuarii]|nr:DUF952 domain-containing protein [Palleronia aestuarii]
MMIYKVLRPAEWSELHERGESAGAPVDRSDGFVHFSTAEQLPETLSKHFAGATGLILLACEANDLGDDLKWEPSRGGALFPHLYRALSMRDVQWHTDLPLEGGRHVLPEELE